MNEPTSIDENNFKDLAASMILDVAQRLYAILDSVDEPRIPAKLQELNPEQYASLYSGNGARDYWAICPYLVQVDQSLFDWIESELAGTAWGIWLSSDLPLMEVRRHLRQYLTVQGPEPGSTMYCRYYDPRLISSFLDVVGPDECDRFLQPFHWVSNGRELFRPLT